MGTTGKQLTHNARWPEMPAPIKEYWEVYKYRVTVFVVHLELIEHCMVTIIKIQILDSFIK